MREKVRHVFHSEAVGVVSPTAQHAIVLRRRHDFAVLYRVEHPSYLAAAHEIAVYPIREPDERRTDELVQAHQLREQPVGVQSRRVLERRDFPRVRSRRYEVDAAQPVRRRAIGRLEHPPCARLPALGRLTNRRRSGGRATAGDQNLASSPGPTARAALPSSGCGPEYPFALAPMIEVPHSLRFHREALHVDYLSKPVTRRSPVAALERGAVRVATSQRVLVKQKPNDIDGKISRSTNSRSSHTSIWTKSLCRSVHVGLRSTTNSQNVAHSPLPVLAGAIGVCVGSKRRLTLFGGTFTCRFTGAGSVSNRASTRKIDTVARRLSA